MKSLEKICLILCSICFVCGMKVKNWGTGNQINRLAYSINDVVQEAFKIVTAAQKQVYPIEDIRHSYTQEWHGVNTSVEFHAYNGWLEDLHLHTANMTKEGELRRFIMSGIQSDESGKGYQHEILLCASCITLHAKRIHYAFESIFHQYETTGEITNGNVESNVSFQLTIVKSYNETIDRLQCHVVLEPITLIMVPDTEFNGQVRGIGIFNFLADHMNHWIERHFVNIVLPSIQQRLDISLRKVLDRRNVCDEFLSS